MHNKIFLGFALVLALTLFSSSAHADLKIKRSGEDKSAEIWIKLDRLNEVEGLIADGKTHEARIVLDALLEQYPDYKEAGELHKKLNNRGEVGAGDAAGGKRKKADLANELWLDFLRLKSAGKIAEARANILAINDLYKDEGVRPAFLADIDREAAEVEEKVETSLKDQFINTEDRLSGLSGLKDSEERLAESVKLYGILCSILSENKGLVRAVSLREKVLRELKKSARIIFAKAETMKGLEGCELARPVFQKLLGILNYPELDYYQLTKRELGYCDE